MPLTYLAAASFQTRPGFKQPAVSAPSLKRRGLTRPTGLADVCGPSPRDEARPNRGTIAGRSTPPWRAPRHKSVIGDSSAASLVLPRPPERKALPHLTF